jgi:hypothetical protein
MLKHNSETGANIWQNTDPHVLSIKASEILLTLQKFYRETRRKYEVFSNTGGGN